MKYLLAGLALVVALVAMAGATARNTPELELRLVSTKETQFPGEQADLRAMLVNNGSTAVYFDQYLMEPRMQIDVDGEWTDCRPVLSILKGVVDKLNWQRVDPGEEAAIEVGGYKCLGNDSVGGRDWWEIPGNYKLKVTASHRVLDSHEVGRLGPAPDGAQAWTLTSKALSVFVLPPLPSGWSVPTPEALREERWRTDLRGLAAYATGDFDGDGATDTAVLAESELESAAGLFVYLAKLPTPEWINLEVIDGPVVGLGLEVYPPGTYSVLCVEPEGGCGGNERQPLLAITDVLSFYRFASSSSVFSWNPQLGNFERFWESD